MNKIGILDSTDFQYNGRKASEFKILSARAVGGLFDETIGGSDQIEEEYVDGNDKPYFKGVTHRPNEFSLTLAFEEPIQTNEELRKVIRWLKPETYKPIIFENMPEKIFYCRPVDSIRHMHNGLGNGYLQLTMRCNTYHAFSPTYISEIYQVTSDTSPTSLVFENKGDLDVQPIFFIRKIGQGNISITNYSHGGRTFTLNNLEDNEELKIDNKNREIKSDTKVNRHDDSNLEWITLVYGENDIEITGQCEIYFQCQFKLY